MLWKTVREKKKHLKDEKNDSIQPKLLTEEVGYRITEAYKTARTNILFALKQKKDCNVIAVTSAVAGEGKTTSVLNLAISFAMTNVRVLVIDADLRKPRIHKYLQIPNENGLANYLGGFSSLEECVVSEPKTGVDYITSGSIPPNPAELLSSPLLKEALEQFSQRYDYIFIDTPPVNVVTDGIIVSKLVDAVLLVARQKYTAHEALKKAFSSLTFAEANVIGFLMNDTAEEQNRKYRYQYRYQRRYYRYGRNYRYTSFGGKESK